MNQSQDTAGPTPFGTSLQTPAPPTTTPGCGVAYNALYVRFEVIISRN
jgi:hypothetical protein